MFTAPKWLPAEAAEFWNEIVAELPPGAGFRHRTAAAMAAQLMLQYRKATESINEHGQVSEIRDDKGVLRKQEPAPEVRIQMQLVDRIPKLLTQLNAATDGTPEPTPRAGSGLLGELGRIAGSRHAATGPAASRRGTKGRRGVRSSRP